MDITAALEIIARYGTDNPPTTAELTSARDTVARELHALRSRDNVDLEALMSLRDAYTAAAAAVTEAETAAAEAASEIDDLLADVPNPDVAAEPTVEVTDEAEQPVAASAGRVLSVTEAVARLGLTARPAAPVSTEPDLASTRTRIIIGTEERPTATLRDLADAFQLSSRSLRVGKDRIARIETEFAPERTMPMTTEGNTQLLEEFVSVEAVAAAGGCCSLPEPIYSNPVPGTTNRPIRASLNTMGSRRGKVTFFPAICSAGGTFEWTCEQDAAVDEDDPTTWKQCVELICDEEEFAEVGAIYSCATVGNFQQRFAPEQWQGFLKKMAVDHARLAELILWDKMRNAVTSTHLLDASGSVWINLLNGVSLAAAAIRQDQRLGDVTLNLWLPEWIKNAIRSDLRSRRLDSGVENLEATDAFIATAFRNENIDVTYSPDVDDIEAFQYDGALSPYPSIAHAILAPDGYFTFLDGGTLDFGTEIRDHNLNRQNKMAMFAESFEGLLARGCNAKALDIPVEVCSNVCACE